MHYNLLARIKNAQMARQESLQMPFSKFDYAVAKALAEAGFVAEAGKKAVGKRNVLEVKLKYKNRRPGLQNFRILSKPSRKVYVGYRELKPIRQNYGVTILSTPAGIMTNRQARKNKVGGERLFEVW